MYNYSLPSYILSATVFEYDMVYFLSQIGVCVEDSLFWPVLGFEYPRFRCVSMHMQFNRNIASQQKELRSKFILVTQRDFVGREIAAETNEQSLNYTEIGTAFQLEYNWRGQNEDSPPDQPGNFRMFSYSNDEYTISAHIALSIQLEL